MCRVKKNTILTVCFLLFPLVTSADYSKEDSGELKTKKIVRWADAVLRVEVKNKSGKELLRSTAFYINKGGDFIVPHHVYEILGEDNFITVSNRHGDEIKEISKIGCLEETSQNICVFNAKNQKVLEFFDPRKTDYWGDVKQGESTVEINFFGQCKRYDFKEFHVFHAGEKKISELFKVDEFMFEEGKEKYFNEKEYLVLQESRFCDGDEGGPIITNQGALLGVMSNIFRMSKCKGCEVSRFLYTALPVTEIRKLIDLKRENEVIKVY